MARKIKPSINPTDNLINTQVSINRAVFALNQPDSHTGEPKGYYRDLMIHEAKAAQVYLTAFLDKMK